MRAISVSGKVIELKREDISEICLSVNDTIVLLLKNGKCREVVNLTTKEICV